MHVTIRPATAADVGFLTDVVVEATFAQGRCPDDFDEVDFRAGFGEWTAEQVRGERRRLGRPRWCEVDGADAGRLRVVRRRDLVEIAGLQLLPEHQSHGVGRTVVDARRRAGAGRRRSRSSSASRRTTRGPGPSGSAAASAYVGEDGTSKTACRTSSTMRRR